MAAAMDLSMSSSRRKPGPTLTFGKKQKWVPAFAGMTIAMLLPPSHA
jgi:hypothetical protein